MSTDLIHAWFIEERMTACGLVDPIETVSVDQDLINCPDCEPQNPIRAALRHAADVMPIDTLLGADKASVWLRDYAEKWGSK